MIRRYRFDILFAPETLDHLKAIERRHHSLIRKEINDKLRFSADRESRNRKLLDQLAPFEATWELRFGPNNRFRVFYQIDPVENVVWILAIGIKERDRLLISGEEYLP